MGFAGRLGNAISILSPNAGKGIRRQHTDSEAWNTFRRQVRDFDVENGIWMIRN